MSLTICRFQNNFLTKNMKTKCFDSSVNGCTLKQDFVFTLNIWKDGLKQTLYTQIRPSYHAGFMLFAIPWSHHYLWHTPDISHPIVKWTLAIFRMFRHHIFGGYWHHFITIKCWSLQTCIWKSICVCETLCPQPYAFYNTCKSSFEIQRFTQDRQQSKTL